MCWAQSGREQPRTTQHAQISALHPTCEHASARPPASDGTRRGACRVAASCRVEPWDGHGDVSSSIVKGPLYDDPCVVGGVPRKMSTTDLHATASVGGACRGSITAVAGRLGAAVGGDVLGSESGS